MDYFADFLAAITTGGTMLAAFFTFTLACEFVRFIIELFTGGGR